MTPFWIPHQASDLAQGGFLPRCLVPRFAPDFGTSDQPQTVPVAHADLIIVTQSCDLENARAQFVALCPIHSLEKFESVNPQFRQKGAWEEVRKGRREGLHLLAALEAPEDNRQALVVDFRQIYSLPFAYLAGGSRVNRPGSRAGPEAEAVNHE